MSIGIISAQSVESVEVMITIERPRLGIDPGTSSPQGKHANHYTNGDRHTCSPKFQNVCHQYLN